MVRDDLADVELADRVFAPHYARALKQKALRGAAVLQAPKADAMVSGSMAEGDAVELFDISGGWAWVRTADAVGYVPSETLGQP
jgi:Bacterial dipeptidyl-peptidase Sh3 domain